MNTQTRTHHIGVRVTPNELERIKLRAKAFSAFDSQPSAFLRRLGLGAPPDPSPQLLETLNLVVAELRLCRRDLYDEPQINKALKEANRLLRQIIEKVA